MVAEQAAQEIAESYGAKFFVRTPRTVTVTVEDVLAFADKFGWNPDFMVGQEMPEGGREYNESLEHCTHDWVVTPDADDGVLGPAPASRRAGVAEADQVTCKFAHARNWQTGEPLAWGTRTKLFRRSVSRISGAAHGIILPAGRIVVAEEDVLRIGAGAIRPRCRPASSGYFSTKC